MIYRKGLAMIYLDRIAISRENIAEQISKKFSYSSIAQRSICGESEYDEFSN